MAKKLAREKREFILWLATPDAHRKVNTQKALAEQLGVHEITLSEWRHQPDVIAEVNRLVDEHFGDEYNEIADSFKREAARGSYNHQKTYFEMLGKYKPTQDFGGTIHIQVTYGDSDSNTRDETE